MTMLTIPLHRDHTPYTAYLLPYLLPTFPMLVIFTFAIYIDRRWTVFIYIY